MFFKLMFKEPSDIQILGFDTDTSRLRDILEGIYEKSYRGKNFKRR